MPREDFGRRLPMDLEMAREIAATPHLLAEQGPSFLQDWGGPRNYQMVARMPVDQRVVYYAVQDGYTTTPELADATGLSTAEVTKALGALAARGMVELGVVSE